MAWFLLEARSLTLTSTVVRGLLFPGKEAEKLHSESERWKGGSHHLFLSFPVLCGFPESSAFIFMKAACLSAHRKGRHSRPDPSLPTSCLGFMVDLTCQRPEWPPTEPPRLRWALSWRRRDSAAQKLCLLTGSWPLCLQPAGRPQACHFSQDLCSHL